MSTGVAFIICAIGIAVLFYLDRDPSVRTSRALWLPVIWVSIVGSRPISAWVGLGPANADVDATLEGNALDAVIFSILLAAGVLVLTRRTGWAPGFFASNRPLVIYFAFCLASVLWSPIVGPSFKRWIKAAGDLIMVLIVATDAHPVAALQRFFSRIGFLLLPASVLLVRYSNLGRGYDPDGNPMNTGVTTNKNMLGVLVMVVGLATVWHVCALLRRERGSVRRSQLVAQCTLLAFSIALLYMAHSATSLACFLLGSGVILACNRPRIQANPHLLHRGALILVLAGAVGLIFDVDTLVVSALGRDTNLTGRTDIWRVVIPLAQNPIIGVGFESFWNYSSKTLREISEGYMFGNLNSAHNGYIETYLNLGLIGLSLIVATLFSAYRLSVRAFRSDPETGSLILAFVLAITIFNISEAGFRVFSPIWISFMLAYVVAGRIAYGDTQEAESASIAEADGPVVLMESKAQGQPAEVV